MIECHDLTKEYGSFKAVDNIDLEAASGEITVLLGPNGAGKSTTIKSIVGLLQFEGKFKREEENDCQESVKGNEAKGINAAGFGTVTEGTAG